jgi:membrane complex biogenesis BtpA family protein
LYSKLFKTKHPIIGMVHLPPLPGAPGWSGDFSKLETFALQDTQALVLGGVDGIIFENFGDAPFTRHQVGSLTVSSMTRVILHCLNNIEVPFGVNVLRNDWRSALSIAAVTGGAFIRANILSGAYLTEQGVIEGEGYSCMRFRYDLASTFGRMIAIFADAHSKHAQPLLEQTLDNAIKDLTERTGVDAVIITGSRSGAPTKLSEVKLASKIAGKSLVIVGSGVNPKNLQDFLPYCQGFIVGSYFKKNGKIDAPVDIERVKGLIKIVDK